MMKFFIKIAYYSKTLVYYFVFVKFLLIYDFQKNGHSL